MTHKTKVLGLIVVGILTVNALAVADAQAEPEFQALEAVENEGVVEEEFVHAPVDATQVEGEPIKLSIEGLSISCQSATATATLATGSSSSLTLSPTFKTCKALFGVLPAEIKFGSCGYTLHGAEHVEADLYFAFADIACPGEEKVVITVKNFMATKTKCIIEVASQSNLTMIHVENMTEAPPVDATVENKIENIEAIVKNGEEECPLPPKTYTNAKISGKTTLTATGEGEVPPNLGMDVVEKFHFQFDEEEAQVWNEQDGPQEFGFDLGKVKCQRVFGDEIFKSKSMTTLYLNGGLAYKECKLGAEEVEIDVNSCWYKVTARQVEKGLFRGKTAILCPKFKAIEVTAKNCTITIKEQQGPKNAGLGEVEYISIGNKPTREITAAMRVNGLAYEEIGLGCKKNGAPTTGTFDGSVIFHASKPFAPGEQLDLWPEKT
jgi:hypothetical protein